MEQRTIPECAAKSIRHHTTTTKRSMDTASSSSGLAPLQLNALSSSIYHEGPSAATRMAVLPPGRGLKLINRIEINRCIERDGVVYYVLEVFTHKLTTANKPLLRSSRVVGMPANATDEVLIDVELSPVADLTLERRYSDFESLRHKLSVCFENLHPGYCGYCDTFIIFLSCSSMQPGLYTKITTRPPQRKSILAKFLNQAIALSLTNPDDGVNGACDGGTIIPQVVESFLRESRSLFNFQMH